MKDHIPAHLSPEAKAFYDAPFDKLPLLDFQSVSEVTTLRTAFTPVWQGLCDQIPFEYAVDELQINGVRCFQFNPASQPNSNHFILYIHGGGLLFGHPTLCKNIPASIARYSGLPVISIEYPLAPENKLDAMVETITKVIEGISSDETNPKYGLLAHSAGSTLALLALVDAKKKHYPLPETITLLSPFVDSSLSGDTAITLENFDANVITPDWAYQSVESYLGDKERQDPLVSPLFADLSDLPPVYIQQAGRDMLMSDAFRLNRRLLQQGVSSTLDIWDGMWHAFQMFPLIPESQQANQATADFFKRYLS